MSQARERMFEEARSPHTTAQRLDDLATWITDPELLAVVAQNPNTPGRTLRRLFPLCPNEVASNPSISLALLENPGLFCGLHKDIPFDVSRREDASEGALWLLLNPSVDRQILRFLALRKELSERFLMELAERGTDADLLLEHPNITERVVKILARRPENKLFFARGAALAESIQEIIREAADEEVLEALRWRDEPPRSELIGRLSYGGETDAGGRDRNDDQFAIYHGERTAMFVVADGVSGNHDGRAAADRCCGVLLRRAQQQERSSINTQRFWQESFMEAFDALVAIAPQDPEVASDDKKFSGNGLWISIAALLLEGEHATIAHLGDCRVYLYRGDQLQALTSDHTIIQGLIDAGRDLSTTKREDLQGVLRALGQHSKISASPTLTRLNISQGDRLLLCSRGVHIALSEDKLCEILQHNDIPTTVKKLIAMSNELGGKTNATVVLVEIE